jgi:Ca2+-binding EF-hand superfamily protein
MNSSFLLGILLLIIAVTALDKGELREEFHRQDTNSDGLLDGDEVRLMLR